MNHSDFLQHKRYLFSIAYNMTGDITVAEDLVQDTFEKWLKVEGSKVQNVKAYLARMVVNKSIDKLNELKKEREVYKGLWMPEPYITEQTDSDGGVALEYAVLFLLEYLNPYERAVFVLKEVFALSHEEIADTLGLTAENSRQLLHRAKDRVKSPRKRTEAEMETQKELTQAFLMAIYQKDFQKLQDIFKEDIVLYSDGGGKVAAALKPIAGIAKVIKFFKGVSELEPKVELSAQQVLFNNTPGYIIYVNSNIDTLLQIEVNDDKISSMFALRNPDKIHLNINHKQST